MGVGVQSLDGEHPSLGRTGLSPETNPNTPDVVLRSVYPKGHVLSHKTMEVLDPTVPSLSLP